MQPKIPAQLSSEVWPEAAIPVTREAHSSGVSWPAVLGGAVAALAVSLVMLALGGGFGLESTSPWDSGRILSTKAEVITVVWMLLSAVVSSALGGYLTGRLRTKWASIHTDEVFFRDTANGLLSWAVSVVLAATLLVSASTALVNRAGKSDAFARPADSAANVLADSRSYLIDTLFRSDGEPSQDTERLDTEAGRIFADGLVHSRLPAADRSYLVTLIARHAGITPQAAERRVAESFANALEARRSTREAAAHFLYWVFLALALGAFSASFFATTGGRQRDRVRTNLQFMEKTAPL